MSNAQKFFTSDFVYDHSRIQNEDTSRTAILFIFIFIFHNISDHMLLPITARDSYCVIIFKTPMLKAMKKHTFQSRPLSETCT
jgi:hypothetical protein